MATRGTTVAKSRRPAKARAEAKPDGEEQSEAPGRAFWSGSISFGLLQIPVGIYSGEKTHETSFRQLDKRDLSPVKYQRVSSSTGKPVEWGDIVKGYAVSKDEYVVVTDEELESALPKATHTIEIQDFVPAEAIDATFYERPYWLAPAKHGIKAYGLFRIALERTGKAAISTVVMRTRQHLCAIFAREDALVLELLRFPHELRTSKGLSLPPTTVSGLHVSERELDMATRLIEEMSGEWEPSKYHDVFRDQLRKIVEEKARTGTISRPESAEMPTASTLDLVAALKESLARSGKGGAANSTGNGATHKKNGRSKRQKRAA